MCTQIGLICNLAWGSSIGLREREHTKEGTHQSICSLSLGPFLLLYLSPSFLHSSSFSSLSLSLILSASVCSYDAPHHRKLTYRDMRAYGADEKTHPRTHTHTHHSNQRPSFVVIWSNEYAIMWRNTKYKILVHLQKCTHTHSFLANQEAIKIPSPHKSAPNRHTIFFQIWQK